MLGFQWTSSNLQLINLLFLAFSIWIWMSCLSQQTWKRKWNKHLIFYFFSFSFPVRFLTSTLWSIISMLVLGFPIYSWVLLCLNNCIFLLSHCNKFYHLIFWILKVGNKYGKDIPFMKKQCVCFPRIHKTTLKAFSTTSRIFFELGHIWEKLY